ncbi:MAG TPA: cytochrome c-type biogenesis protein [Chloroflexota bacterium]|nr:cytochrome c-type biogenesis protein [Chloroflexota bacterium]
MWRPISVGIKPIAWPLRQFPLPGGEGQGEGGLTPNDNVHFETLSALTPALSPRRGGIGPARWILLALILFTATGILASGTAFADDLGQQQLEVEKQLGCPICTDLPLNVCTNQICEQMKGIIHQKLNEGETPDQVVQYFVARYGEGILLTPPQQGFNLAVWYLPVLALLFGGFVVWAFVRQSVRRQGQIDRRLSENDVALDLYRERVRREVDRLEDIG